MGNELACYFAGGRESQNRYNSGCVGLQVSRGWGDLRSARDSMPKRDLDRVPKACGSSSTTRYDGRDGCWGALVLFCCFFEGVLLAVHSSSKLRTHMQTMFYLASHSSSSRRWCGLLARFCVPLYNTGVHCAIGIIRAITCEKMGRNGLKTVHLLEDMPRVGRYFHANLENFPGGTNTLQQLR